MDPNGLSSQPRIVVTVPKLPESQEVLEVMQNEWNDSFTGGDAEIWCFAMTFAFKRTLRGQSQLDGKGFRP